MIALARAMFDAIDSTTGAPHASVEARTGAYAKYLQKRNDNDGRISVDKKGMYTP